MQSLFTSRTALYRGLFVLALCVGALIVGVQHAGAQPVEVLPPSGQWVTDRADVLTAAEEQTLTTRLRAYADTTSTQIIVVTLPTLGGADIALYTTELGQQWGVGQEDTDNGAVILVARDDREVFIATGYGLEGAIPDAVASRIVRNILVPNFRQNRFYAGLSAAADALMQAAAGEYTADAPPVAYEEDDSGGGSATLIFILLIIAYFVITGVRGGGGGSGGRRYRSRGGPPIIIWGGGSGGGFGGGGFSGGGGGFGGGGAGGSW
jgi:uncharacterized protein